LAATVLAAAGRLAAPAPVVAAAAAEPDVEAIVDGSELGEGWLDGGAIVIANARAPYASDDEEALDDPSAEIGTAEGPVAGDGSMLDGGDVRLLDGLSLPRAAIPIGTSRAIAPTIKPTRFSSGSIAVLRAALTVASGVAASTSKSSSYTSSATSQPPVPRVPALPAMVPYRYDPVVGSWAPKDAVERSSSSHGS